MVVNNHEFLDPRNKANFYISFGLILIATTVLSEFLFRDRNIIQKFGLEGRNTDQYVTMVQFSEETKVCQP